MNRKSILVALFCVGFLLIFVNNSKAQNKTENFSYRELLIEQKAEREEMKQNQEQILDKIIVRQRDEYNAIPKDDNGYERNRVRESHQGERENIVKLQKEEREKLAQIHADERKLFIKPKF